MPLFSETSDVSVRPAVPGDELAIAQVQLAAWRDTHADVFGTALDDLDAEAISAGWHESITAPPGPGYRVLVALAGPQVVGFAAVAPVAAPEGEARGGVLVALEVTPTAQRGGHGSRLLAAVVDLLREDGADQLHTWVLDGDDARARFLRESGLGPDDVAREVVAGTLPDGTHRTVNEHRWSAGI
ncbi:GNAT family N-acetyltransferase [Cellulomonas alba]|uniref:GNAT family N-acetyltransferase n=1 Tax=Cellulomonas alba TaxID=3053467 RepID=A0ABT7SIY4_9CELL|nr:GNAT family N-acetyltransferase [Cellulomonas alba]MDM7856128.1 GNAT family N-acetyltransferase [Cellulomonas alba]